MIRLRLASLAAVSVAVLIALACGGGTTTAPAGPAPSAIAPAVAPTTVEIAPTVDSIPSALSVANAFFEAFNEGDVAALTSLYSDEVSLTVGPVFPGQPFQSRTGLEAVLEGYLERLDLHGHYTPSNVRAEGNTVTSQFTFSDEEFEGMGLATISGSMSFKVEHGKIITIVVTPDEESKQKAAALAFAIQPIWSPDGRYIAFQVRRGDFDGAEIYVMRVDGTEQTNLTDNSSHDCCPVWSPDSGHLAFVVIPEPEGYLQEIHSMRIDGTEQVNLTNDPSPQHFPIWSPDGRHIAFILLRGITDIYTMRADGTEQTKLTDVSADPVWSPDSSRIAFFSTRDGNEEIYVMRADGTEQTQLTNSLAHDFFPAWSPDGEFIAFLSDRDSSSLPAILHSLEIPGEEQVFDIYVMRADGTEQTRLTHNPGNRCCDHGRPAWSPDGEYLASVLVSRRADIHVMRADGTEQTQLTTGEHNDGRPAWSPDGSKIAFDSDRDGNPEIYVMNADGSDQTRLTRFSQ